MSKMSKTFTNASSSGARRFTVACVVFATLALGGRQAHAQGRDSLLNGTLIGAAVGAGAGVILTRASIDTELGFVEYSYGALAFGGIGAGVGLGIDALLNRASTRPGVTRRRVLIAPTVWRNVAGVVVKWRW
jgi:hypothetical protein